MFPKLLLILPSLLTAHGQTPLTAHDGAPLPATCDGSTPVQLTDDGQRRLALLVGVGRYARPGIPTLRGPAHDARRLAAFIQQDGEEGFGFPAANICLLQDEEATESVFLEAFQRSLADRVLEGDEVLIYFAGHGSRVPDDNGDEIDGFDETLMFHDAQRSGLGLRDDALNTLLASLERRGARLTLVLDSCNSGSAARGGDEGITTRFYAPAQGPQGASAGPATPDAHTDAGWIPAGLPSAVILSAAGDGYSALELDGHGCFTDALLQVLAQGHDQPLTWRQVSRQVRPLLALQRGVAQVPHFQGDLDRHVFASQHGPRERSWEVKAIDGDTIWLSGVQIPGWSAGALVELTPTAGSEDGLLLRLEEVDGIQARAVPAAQEQDVQGASVPRSARLGDRAVLVVPGERASVLEVYVPPETESDAPSAALREDIAASIADEGLGAVVRLVPWLASLELSAPGGRVELRDGGGDTLNRFQTLPDGRPVTRADLSWVVATSLGQYARQRVLLQLRGHEGERFANNDSLQVQVVPAPFKADCPGIHWPEEQQPTNEPQVVPLCHPWQIQVRNTSRSTLLVGGGVLTTDGGIFSLPWAGAERPYLVIPPGQTAIFDRDEPQACFTGTPPFHVPTHIVVVGTQKDEPVDWRLLSAQAISRDPTAGDIQSALAGCLMGARDAGTRLDLSDWTTTHLTVQTLSPDTPQPTPTGQAP